LLFEVGHHALLNELVRVGFKCSHYLFFTTAKIRICGRQPSVQMLIRRCLSTRY
jgi:hypothetical protein